MLANPVRTLSLGLRAPLSGRSFRVTAQPVLPGNLATLADVSLAHIPSEVMPHDILLQTRIIPGGINVPRDIIIEGLQRVSASNIVYGNQLDGDFVELTDGMSFLNRVMKECWEISQTHPRDEFSDRRGIFAGLVSFHGGQRLGIEFNCREFKNGDRNNFTVMVLDLNLPVLDRLEQ